MISPTIIQSSTSAIEATFISQQKTAKQWRSSTAEERIERLNRIKNWIKKNQDEIRNSLWADFKNQYRKLT